MYIRSCSQCG